MFLRISFLLVLLSISSLKAMADLPAMPALVDLEGQKVTAVNDRSYTLINFWATWCAPCRVEMPELDALHAANADRDFAVVGVAADEMAEVQDYIEQIGVSYPILVGDSDQVFAWSGELGNVAMGLPFSVIVNQEGDVLWRQSGGKIEQASMQEIIDELLK